MSPGELLAPWLFVAVASGFITGILCIASSLWFGVLLKDTSAGGRGKQEFEELVDVVETWPALVPATTVAAAGQCCSPFLFFKRDFLFCVCPAVASFHNDCLFGVSGELPALILCPPTPLSPRTPRTAHPTPPRNWRAPCSRWSPPLFRRDTSACWVTAMTFTTLTGSQTTTCWTR